MDKLSFSSLEELDKLFSDNVKKAENIESKPAEEENSINNIEEQAAAPEQAAEPISPVVPENAPEQPAPAEQETEAEPAEQTAEPEKEPEAVDKTEKTTEPEKAVEPAPAPAVNNIDPPEKLLEKAKKLANEPVEDSDRIPGQMVLGEAENAKEEEKQSEDKKSKSSRNSHSHKHHHSKKGELVFKDQEFNKAVEQLDEEEEEDEEDKRLRKKYDFCGLLAAIAAIALVLTLAGSAFVTTVMFLYYRPGATIKGYTICPCEASTVIPKVRNGDMFVVKHGTVFDAPKDGIVAYYGKNNYEYKYAAVINNKGSKADLIPTFYCQEKGSEKQKIEINDRDYIGTVVVSLPFVWLLFGKFVRHMYLSVTLGVVVVAVEIAIIIILLRRRHRVYD